MANQVTVYEGITPMASLTGRTAVVTGAAGGIGLAVATRLVADGARVYCVDINEVGVQQSTQRIGASGAFACDISDVTSVTSVVDAVVADAGRIDILVNSAGIHRPAPFLEITEDDFDLMMRVNVKGTFLPSQAVARVMAQTGRGSIVNFASIAAEHCTPISTAYATTKGAVISMTRGMAVSLAHLQIRVNAIAPGPVETPMTASSREDPGYVARMIDRVPLQRSGVPDDIAGVVAFLASDDSAWITGEVLHVDGGISVLR